MSEQRATVEVQPRPIIVNCPSELADELVEGCVDIWRDIVCRSPEGLVVRRVQKPAGRVGLAIGNGLGHEPAMIGLVGPGLFDVNIPGGLFAAPSPSQIAAGIRRADRGAGVLLCVSNHSGDILAAQTAVELLGPADPPVRLLPLWDDISTSPEHGSERRGGPGLLFAWKLLGAAAEEGYDLEACVALGERIRGRIRSLSAVLAGTRNPLTSQAVSLVPEGYALIGAGVHGDATGTLVELTTADDLAAYLIEQTTDDLDLRPSDRCALVINDAGALSVAEGVLVARAAIAWLRRRSIAVERVWLGRYATTLAVAGVSVAVCKIDDELLRLWDAPCRGGAFNTLGGGSNG